MDDVVDAQNEGAGRRMGTEKIRIALHEDGHGPPSEPAQHVGWRHRQRARGGEDELRHVFVRIAAQRRVGPRQPGLIQQGIPGILAVAAPDHLLEEIEYHPFHEFHPE